MTIRVRINSCPPAFYAGVRGAACELAPGLTTVVLRKTLGPGRSGGGPPVAGGAGRAERHPGAQGGAGGRSPAEEGRRQRAGNTAAAGREGAYGQHGHHESAAPEQATCVACNKPSRDNVDEWLWLCSAIVHFKLCIWLRRMHHILQLWCAGVALSSALMFGLCTCGSGQIHRGNAWLATAQPKGCQVLPKPAPGLVKRMVTQGSLTLGDRSLTLPAVPCAGVAVEDGHRPDRRAGAGAQPQPQPGWAEAHAQRCR